MGKKKFIDKKKSATFQLLPRDSSDPNYNNSSNSDRVFVRVDTNPLSFGTVFDEHNNRILGSSSSTAANDKDALPENVRKEILELGFPDDGYNYLIHLRDIRSTGPGSDFHHNSKFKPGHLPRDVKAYDASSIQILNSEGNYNEESIYNVASNTLNARMNKVVDPEVAALLDDSDSSQFGSDVEDMEEDFVVIANNSEGEDDESDKKLSFAEESEFTNEGVKNADSKSSNQEIANEVGNYQVEEKSQVQRLLNEQFDIVAVEKE